MFSGSGFTTGGAGSGNSGSGFGGFGSGSSSLFGAKSAAPGEEAKPAAAPSNIFGSSAASKPDTAKSSVPFSFGNLPAASAATPTPAAPSIFGASSSSATTGGLFGAKPASGSSIFGASSTTTTTAPASSAAPALSAAAPAVPSFGGFSLNLGGATKPAEAPTTKPLLGGGFQFGAPSLSSATTSTAAAPASSAAADSKAAPFGLKTDAPAATNPTAGTGLGGFKLSTAPVVSGAGSSDGKMTGTSTPSLSILGLGSTSSATAPATAAPASAGAAAAAPAAKAAGKVENATELANAALRGKTMDEIAQMWTSELAEQTRAFHTQASTVSYWDRALVQQGKRITELYDATMSVEAEQAALDKSLEHMEGQQDALQSLLDDYEGRVQSIVRKTTPRPAGGRGAAMSSDEERDKVYSSAENLNMQLDELTTRLTSLVTEVNNITSASTAASDAAAADPLTQIVLILNRHLASLEWIGTETATLQERVKNAQRVFQDVNAAQTAIADNYGGGAPVDDRYAQDYSAPDALRDNPRLTIPGAFGSEPAPPVTSSFGTPMATARKPLNSSLFGRGGASGNAPPASPFGSTPLRRGF
ncbi:FG-nucleoporin nsp1 [Coemansia sp. IMI 209128]|nr:FG-nucleoporin nsp1 [Coemansia sp. RSA 2530]KAJ2700241.1 FG-nucleoporin nsp1 [Coemansia sp. IMI 209128]